MSAPKSSQDGIAPEPTPDDDRDGADAAPNSASDTETTTEAADSATEDASGEDVETERDPAEEIAEITDRWLRAKADADNARRRAQLDVADAHRYGATTLLASLLDVLDNLQRALATPPDGLDEAFLEGLRMTEQQWLGVLVAHGVQPVEAQPGQPLDPTVHRALMEQDDADLEPGTIALELVRGYRLHDRLLREAQVAVVKAR